MASLLSIKNSVAILLILSVYALSESAMSTYQSSMITTLEKRFQLGTTRIGWLLGANNFGALLAILFLSYFSSKGNAPRVLAICAFGVALSSVIYDLPFFIYGPKLSAEKLAGISSAQDPVFNSSEQVTQSKRGYQACTGLNTNASVADLAKEASREGLISHTQSIIGFTFMVIGRVVHGVCSSPVFAVGISLLDDVAGTKRSGVYIGIIYAIITLSPTFGYLFGSFAATIHESLKLTATEHPGGQKDPRWIGAWWIGFLFFGVMSLFVAPLIWCIKVKRSDQPTGDTANFDVPLHARTAEQDETDAHPTESIQVEPRDTTEQQLSLKHMAIVIFRLMKRPVFVSLVLGSIFHIVALIPLYSYVAKILEYSFFMVASQANVIAGAVISGAYVLAVLCSGLIDRRWPMSVRGMCLFNACMALSNIIIVPLFFAFSCPSPEIRGMGANGPVLSCVNASTCRCSAFYRPACVDDVTYFSACHAGCTNLTGDGTKYEGCVCGNATKAEPGACMEMCPQVYLFASLLFAVFVFNGLSSVQYTKVGMSQTSVATKSVALGTLSFFYQLTGMVVPSLFGKLIDTACEIRYPGSDNCLVYDGPRMSRLVYIFCSAAMVPAFLFQAAAWYFSPKNVKEKEKSSDTT